MHVHALFHLYTTYTYPLPQDHLVGVHLLASNLLATSTAENLNAAHPIRRMLRPHTYGAVSVNQGAVTNLASMYGILHRSVAMSWDSLNAALFKSFDLHRSVVALSLCKLLVTQQLQRQYL